MRHIHVQHSLLSCNAASADKKNQEYHDTSIYSHSLISKTFKRLLFDKFLALRICPGFDWQINNRDSKNKMMKIKQRKTRELHEMFKIQLTFETIPGVREIKYTLIIQKSIK